jgi:hypothetical protein
MKQSGLRSFLFLLIFSGSLIFPVQGEAQRGKNNSIKFAWTFKYTRFPGKIKIYEVEADKSYDAGETKAEPLGEANPFKRLAPDLIDLEPNVLKPLALVIENPTDSPWYFYANFHNYIPVDNAVGLSLQCVCNNTIFEVPPQSRWSRLVNTKSKRLLQGDRLNIEHEIIGLTQEEVRKKRLENVVNKGM